MKSAKNVHGEIFKTLGIFILSAIGYLLSFFAPAGALSNFLNIKTIPCLGLGLLSGILYIFWIALAREFYGRGHGTIVAILTISFILLGGPWYGITDPVYFGIFGFLSFLAMGTLTDFWNGGIGSVSCLVINWIAFSYFRNFSPSPLWLALLVLLISFISGAVFDYLAKLFVNRVSTFSSFS